MGMSTVLLLNNSIMSSDMATGGLTGLLMMKNSRKTQQLKAFQNLEKI